MEFFCVKCQKKHNAAELASDIWELFREDIAKSLEEKEKIITQEIANEYNAYINEPDETMVGSWLGTLEKFAKDKGDDIEEAKARKCFAIKGSELNSRLKNARWNSGHTVLQGRYSLSLGDFVDIYIKCKGNSVDENGAKCFAYFKQQSKEIQKLELLDKELNCTFLQVDDSNVLVSVKKTDDSQPIYKRICPECGYSVSSAVGRAPEVIVALAGSPRVGKTSCIVAIASALEAGVHLNECGLILNKQRNDESWDFLQNQIDCYRKNQKPEKTNIDQNEAPTYSLLIDITGDGAADNQQREQRVLTFVDMPGEFWEDTESGRGLSADFFKQYSGLYRNIDCIWMFISKLVVWNLSKEKLDDKKDKIAADTSESPEIIYAARPQNLNSNLNILKQELGALPPVAVIVSKAELQGKDFDLGREERDADSVMFPDEYTAQKNADAHSAAVTHVGNRIALNERVLHKCSVEVKNYIVNRNRLLCHAIESNFSRRFYMSMAAYGHPAADKNYREPWPYRELFPVLWTLAITGAIETSHLVQLKHKNLFGNIANRGERNRTIKYDYRTPKPGRIRAQDAEFWQLFEDIESNLFMQRNEYKKSEKMV